MISSYESILRATKLRTARAEQLNEIRKTKELMQCKLAEIKNETAELAALQSVALGLYEELDKLTKKSPIEKITNFALSQLNDVIRETKRLVVNDAYVQKLNEAVSAGDNPE